MFFSLHGSFMFFKGFPEELAYRGYLNQTLRKTDSYHPDISLCSLWLCIGITFFTYQGAEVFIEFFYPFVLVYWQVFTLLDREALGQQLQSMEGSFSILSQIILACWMVAIVLLIIIILMLLVSVIIILKNPENSVDWGLTDNPYEVFIIRGKSSKSWWLFWVEREKVELVSLSSRIGRKWYNDLIL